MKIVFSTKNVSRTSFLDMCRYAYAYGFNGFEIYDAVKERSVHHDSVLRRERIADAKRKLVNRNLSVSALRMPATIDSEETTAKIIEEYVNMAALSGIENVIVSVEKNVSFDVLDEKMAEAIKRAEKTDVNILFETIGYLANTENVIGIINHFASSGNPRGNGHPENNGLRCGKSPSRACARPVPPASRGRCIPAGSWRFLLGGSAGTASVVFAQQRLRSLRACGVGREDSLRAAKAHLLAGEGRR